MLLHAFRPLACCSPVQAGSICTCGNIDVPFTQLTSANGQHVLAVQGDGSIVQRTNGSLVWAAQTQQPDPSASAPFQLVLRATGELAALTSSGVAYWTASTGGKGQGPYRLTMQNNGNCVVYASSGSPLWSTNTASTYAQPFKRWLQQGPQSWCHSKLCVPPALMGLPTACRLTCTCPLLPALLQELGCHSVKRNW